ERAARRVDERTGMHRAAFHSGHPLPAPPAPNPFSPPGPGSEAYDPMMQTPTREVLVELASSELGVLFLDRTRLRPSGFVVGEHLHTIGLAAGEEVVLEQTSFVQHDKSGETTDEQETTNESEGTLADTRDDSEVITGTQTTTRTDGFNAGGNLGFEYG